MNIALRTPNWIGDCIMSLPAVKSLWDTVPGVSIYVFTRSHLADIYRHLPQVRDIILIPERMTIPGVFSLRKRVRSIDFSRGILLTNSFGSALLFRLAGIKPLVGYRREGRGWLLGGGIEFPRDIGHYLTFYQQIVSSGKTDSNAKSAYSLTPRVLEEEKDRIREMLGGWAVDFSHPLIGLSPFAAYGTAKEWPYFDALMERIQGLDSDSRLMLLGGLRDREKARRLLGRIQNPERVINLTGLLTLRESMAAISLCTGFVANDSGLMHIADALGIPLVAIFGPTTLCSIPLNIRSVYLHRKVSCSPCAHRHCPTDHRCMTGILDSEVYQALQQVMQNC